MRQFGSKGTDPGKFNAVTDITFDTNGRLHEADSSAFSLQMFSKEGDFLAMWKLPDTMGLEVWSPTKIAAVSDNILFVSDVAHNRIYKLQIQEVHQP